MAYIINRFDGTQLSIVDDGVLDNSTSLGLIGRNYTGYGETQNENFVFLLENFANNAPPTRALRGQIWYNTTEKALKVYGIGPLVGGAPTFQWLSIGNATVAETDPAHSNGGLWLKSTTNQLYVSDGTVWRQVGPEGVDGFAVTKMTSTAIRDSFGSLKPVIIAQVNGETTTVYTNEAFVINIEDNIPGFNQLFKGINVKSDSVVNGNLRGNADTATQFQTSRTINNVVFNGTSNITVTSTTNQPLKAGDYIIGSEFNGAFDTTWDIDADPENRVGKIVARDSTGSFSATTVTAAEFVGELLGNVTTLSGTSTFNNMVVNTITGTSFSGLAARATQLSARRTINTVAFDGTEDIILPVPAETLTGNTLAANIVASSLTSLGQLEFLSVEAPGITVGDGNNLNIKIEGFTPTIESDTTNIIKLKLATGGVTAGSSTTVTFLSSSAAAADGVGLPALVPDYTLGTAIDNRPVLGLPSHRWRNIYSKAATLDTLNVTTLSGRTVDDQVVVSNNLAVTGAMYGAVFGTLTGSVTGAASLNLLKSGDGMSGDISWNTSGRGLSWGMNSDSASIRYYNSTDNSTDNRLEFNTGDNLDEFFRWTHTSASTTFESMRLTPNASGLANLRVSGQITVVGGGVSAATYIGDGNQITNLNATQILTGTVPAARLTGSYNINVVGNITGNVAGNVTGNTQGVHTGSVVGNATTATTWATGRTITLTGDVTGVSAAFDGGGNLSFATTIAANSVALGTDTTGQYASTVTVSGTGLSATAVNADDGTAYTITSNATSANTGNTLVSRAANGNFDAGTITATFSGNITGNVAGNVTGAASLNLLKSGDAMTGDISWSTTGRGLSWGMNTDGASIRFYNTGDGDTASRLEFQTTDNGNEYFSWTHALSGGGTVESMRLVSTSDGNAALTVFGNATINGTTTGTFSGVGTALTLNAGNLTTGTVPSGRLSGTYNIGITGNAATATLAVTATNAGQSNNSTRSLIHTVTDSRATVTTPQTINQGVVFDFKQNTTEGLSDGGTYFGEMTFRKYGESTDWSGGPAHQLGFTENANIYHRIGSNTSWNSWKKILDSANFNSYSPTLTGGGASGTWNINITGNAATVTSVPFTSITGRPNFVLNDGATYGINISGNAATASTAPEIYNLGNVTAESNGTAEPSNKLTLRSVYANGYPTSYGNALTLGGAGGGELLIGWSGSTGAHADNYVRSRRDTGNIWSAWAKLITDVNINSYAPTLTGGSASGTWAINITGNAVTVTAISSGQVTTALGYTPVNPSTLTNQSGSAGNFSSVTASGDIQVNKTNPTLFLNHNGGGFDSGIELAISVQGEDFIIYEPDDGNREWFRINDTGTFGSASVYGYTILDARNYNSYAPTLTGTGASGTWAINVTGQANTVGLITFNQVTTALGYTPVNPSVLTNQSGSAGSFSSITATTGNITGTLQLFNPLLTQVGNLTPNYDLISTATVDISDALDYLKLEAGIVTANNWLNFAWIKGSWVSSYGVGGVFGIEGNAINALREAIGLTSTASGDTMLFGNVTDAGVFYNGLMISENTVILKGKKITIDSEDGVAITVNASIQANIIGNVSGSAATVTTISSAQIVTALGYTPVNPSVLTNQSGSAGNFSTIAATGDITITKSQPTIFFNDSGDGGIELAIRVNSSEGLIIYEPEDADSQWFRIDDNSGTGYLWESQILTAANYATFAPGKTGSGASGTWAINVTGNASTVSTVTSGQITGGLGFTPISKSGDTVNGELNLQDFNLKRATIIDYSLAHNALGNVSGSTSLNMELGNYVSATAVGAVTWSFTNPPTSSSGVASRAGSIILELTNGGAYTQYWPAATRWPAGTAPSLTSSGVDVLVFITDDAGTNWRGAISMSDSR